MTTKQYQIVNGIAFNEGTGREVINALLNVKRTNKRIRIWYGDTVTGKAWNEEFDVTGTVSNSTGTYKIPLLINNSRSFGGTGILDHCIVRIDDIAAKRTIYKHSSFHTDDYTIKPIENKELIEKGYTHSVGEGIANFKSEEKAQRFVDFMTGKRYSK